MRKFTRTKRVSADSAIHDRIELKFGALVGELNGESISELELQRFLNYLATPPAAVRDELSRNRRERLSGTDARTTAAGDHGLIFNRAGGRQPTFRKLDVRGTSRFLRDGGGEIPPPLFSGRLRANTHSHSSLITLTADLSLNPTRYVHHAIQRGRRRLVLNPFADVFERELPPVSRAEWSLDGNDNWIPLNDEKILPRTTAEISDLRRRYIQNVHSRIAYEIDAAARLSGIDSPPMQFHGSLRVCETYWEFLAHEPLRLIESFEMISRHFASATERHTFACDENVLMLRSKIRAGVWLRIYAKTNRRIRFEIEHNLARCHVPFDHAPAFHSLSEMEESLAILRDDAVDIVNQFLEMADKSKTDEQIGQLSPAAFCLRVLWATRQDDGEQAEEILQILCTSGRIVAGNRNPHTPAIMQLKRWGFLKNRARTSVYVPSTSCRHAVRFLKESGRLPLFFYSPEDLDRRRARGV